MAAGGALPEIRGPDNAYHSNSHRLNLLIKRCIDTAGSILGLVLALPILLAVACTILLTSGRPVIYRAQRIGRWGRPFTMYKFRTMRVGAHDELTQLASLNLSNGMIKIPEDPRVTNVGIWLRRFSLDELPQLWNVLRGDMSLVGPRPHDVTDLSPEDEVHTVRLRMRPGLTGLWQISARNDPSLSVRVYYDLVYVSRWSLGSDLKILARTLPAVLGGGGGHVHVPQSPMGGSRPDEVTWPIASPN
jgi:lipopolysaccharide/colanic/teichoic acid biosynthesis glycosyltransferase